LEDSQLEIRVSQPSDLQKVVRFFERTVYDIRSVAEDKALLTPPGKMDLALARREVEIYLGTFERLHPEVAVSLRA
jgi:hypothetical protein